MLKDSQHAGNGMLLLRLHLQSRMLHRQHCAGPCEGCCLRGSRPHGRSAAHARLISTHTCCHAAHMCCQVLILASVPRLYSADTSALMRAAASLEMKESSTR